MTYRGGVVSKVLGWSVMCAIVAGCGAMSDSGGGSSSTPTGGTSATTTLTSLGGVAASSGTSSVLVSGGTTAKLSGTYASTGGIPTTSPLTTAGTVGTSSTGGTKTTTGGSQATTGGASSTVAGGKTGVGGVTNTGGKATTTTGGNTTTAGTTATGGSSHVGGTTATGGSSNSGGTSALTTGLLDAGPTLNDFCTGSNSKVSYQGQVIQAPATSYQSSLILDCCQAYGVNLHTKPTLDFDLSIETIWMSADTGTYSFVVGSSYQPMRASVHRSVDSASMGAIRADGTGVLLTPFSFEDPYDLGLCLQLQATAAALYGTLIYIPKVTISSFSSRGRFQIFLLSDTTITTTQAATQPLDALTLAQNPILDLYKITYLSSSSHELGFNPGQTIGDAVQTQLGSSIAVPFVAMADGVRIFLGTFVSAASSMAYSIPTVMIEGITTDAMKLSIPAAASNDPLADARIVTVFTSLGKLIP
jgi:hypothetical protein